MYSLADAYPADAIGGSDFLTLAAQRKIIDIDEHGTEVVRPERIVITDRVYTGDEYVQGRPCFSEQTIRALGAQIGLVDPPAMRKILNQQAKLVHRLDQSEGARMDLLRAIEAIQNTAGMVRVYVAGDGSEHPSREALDAYLRGDDELEPTIVSPHQEA
jgi:hypothetical protein